MAYLKKNHPDLNSWLEQVGAKEFIIENLILASLDPNSSEKTKSSLTATGVLWVAFGLHIFWNHLLSDPSKEFSFFVNLWNIIVSFPVTRKLEDLELKEVESFDYRKDWALDIIADTLEEFLNTDDTMIINPMMKNIKSIFLFALSNLKNKKRIKDQFLIDPHTDRFFIGFTPIKVFQMESSVSFLSPKLAEELLHQDLPMEQKNLVEILLMGAKFISFYLQNLENGFNVLQYNLD